MTSRNARTKELMAGLDERSSSRRPSSQRRFQIRRTPQLTTMLECVKYNSLRTALSFVKESSGLSTVHVLDMGCGSAYLVVKLKGLLNELWPSSCAQLHYTGVDLLRTKLEHGTRQFQSKVQAFQAIQTDLFDAWPRELTRQEFHVIACYFPQFERGQTVTHLASRAYKQLSDEHGGVFVFTSPVRSQMDERQLANVTPSGRWTYTFESKAQKPLHYEDEVLEEKEIEQDLERAGFRHVTSASFPTHVAEAVDVLTLSEMSIFQSYRVYVCYKTPFTRSSHSVRSTASSPPRLQRELTVRMPTLLPRSAPALSDGRRGRERGRKRRADEMESPRSLSASSTRSFESPQKRGRYESPSRSHTSYSRRTDTGSSTRSRSTSLRSAPARSLTSPVTRPRSLTTDRSNASTPTDQSGAIRTTTATVTDAETTDAVVPTDKVVPAIGAEGDEGEEGEVKDDASAKENSAAEFVSENESNKSTENDDGEIHVPTFIGLS